MNVLFERGAFWEDPSVYLVDALPPHATLWPFSDAEHAQKPDATFGVDSDRYHSLNGIWKFLYFSNAHDVPNDFIYRSRTLLPGMTNRYPAVGRWIGKRIMIFPTTWEIPICISWIRPMWGIPLWVFIAEILQCRRSIKTAGMF